MLHNDNDNDYHYQKKIGGVSIDRGNHSQVMHYPKTLILEWGVNAKKHE